jgi:hypothetical protein
MEMIERVARAISGQDEAGWLDLPENDRERLYGGGKWHDAGRTRQDYRDEARAAIEAMEYCAPVVRDESGGVIHELRGAPSDIWAMLFAAALSTPPEPVGREK